MTLQSGDQGKHLQSVPGADEFAPVLLNKVPALVAYWDADLRCRFANGTHEAWAGVKPQDLVGKRLSDLLGPLTALNGPCIEAVLRGEPQEFEREIPDPAGGPTRHSLATYIPDVVDGVVRGFFVHATDISRVKRRELALRQSEEQFRLTLDEAALGIALISIEGRLLRANRSLCDILGYSAQELVGMTVQSLMHPGDLEAVRAIAGQLAGGEIVRYSLEKRCVRKDGSTVDVELSGSVVRGTDGQAQHFIAQVEDISERKRTEAERQFLAELGPVLTNTLDPEAIFDQVVQLVTSTMADFCIIDSVDPLRNDEQVQCMSVASRGVEANWLADTLVRLQVDRTKPHLLSAAMRTRGPVLLQRPTDDDLAALSQGPEHLRLLRAMQIESMVAVPMIVGERLIGGIALIASEGSREYDERDVRLAQELAWRVTISIQNARLYVAAREASKVRDEVLAIVAHDLRNPLSTIAFQAELLRRRKQPTASADAIAGENIRLAVARMVRLIEDLLDVSQVEAGQLAIEQAPLDPGPFLLDCVGSQRDLAERASIDLRLEAQPQLPPLWADRDRLSQVFENLIGNALKFSASGGSITVGAEVRADEVLFSVRDTGVGIEPGHLTQLFDRFWQARRAERKGAGLGLPIVKGIVQAHGGRIWVESTPGAGSCFFFTIPKADRRA